MSKFKRGDSVLVCATVLHASGGGVYKVQFGDYLNPLPENRIELTHDTACVPEASIDDRAMRLRREANTEAAFGLRPEPIRREIGGQDVTGANTHQVGGDHYQAAIQAWDAIIAWGLGFLDGTAVKYLARWRKKGGIQDLEKARHYIDKQIESELAKSSAPQQES